LSRSISLLEASAISDLTNVVVFGEGGPALHGGLAGRLAGVHEVELAAGLVVRHRALRFTGSQRGPRSSLLGVVGAANVGEFGSRSVAGDAVEHAAGADRGELLAVADRDQLRP
jgi:hypothetical protein